MWKVNEMEEVPRSSLVQIFIQRFHFYCCYFMRSCQRKQIASRRKTNWPLHTIMSRMLIGPLEIVLFSWKREQTKTVQKNYIRKGKKSC